MKRTSVFTALYVFCAALACANDTNNTISWLDGGPAVRVVTNAPSRAEVAAAVAPLATTQQVANAIAPLATTQQVAAVAAQIPDVSGLASTQSVADVAASLASLSNEFASLPPPLPPTLVTSLDSNTLFSVASGTATLWRVESADVPVCALAFPDDEPPPFFPQPMASSFPFYATQFTIETEPYRWMRGAYLPDGRAEITSNFGAEYGLAATWRSDSATFPQTLIPADGSSAEGTAVITPTGETVGVVYTNAVGTFALYADLAPLATTQQVAEVAAQIPDVSGLASTQQVAEVEQDARSRYLPMSHSMGLEGAIFWGETAGLYIYDSWLTAPYVILDYEQIEHPAAATRKDYVDGLVAPLATTQHVAEVAAQIPDVSGLVSQEALNAAVAPKLNRSYGVATNLSVSGYIQLPQSAQTNLVIRLVTSNDVIYAIGVTP